MMAWKVYYDGALMCIVMASSKWEAKDRVANGNPDKERKLFKVKKVLV